MILTTRVFCPHGTQYTGGGGGGGDYLSWEYLSMGTKYPRKKCPGDKTFCLGGQNWSGTENPPTPLLKGMHAKSLLSCRLRWQ